MALDENLKKVEDSPNTFETKIVSTNSTLSGTKLKFTKADRTDLTQRPYGNLFSSFNLPILDTQKEEFTVGKFADSALEKINQDQVIIIEIPRDEYGELIDGKTIELTLPINTGATDTIISIYGTYFGDDSENTTNGNTKRTDALSELSDFGIEPSIDNELNTNITPLFSNEIKAPQVPFTVSYNTVDTSTKTGSTATTYSITGLTFTENSNYRVKFTNFTWGGNVTDFTDRSLTLKINDTTVYTTTTPTTIDNSSFNITLSSIPLSGDTLKIITEADVSIPKSSTYTVEVQNEVQTSVISSPQWDKWSVTNKFNKTNPIFGDTGKRFANFKAQSDRNADEAVGLAFLDKGFFVITHPTIVNNFLYNSAISSGYDSIPSGTTYTGDSNFTQIYFSSSTSAQTSFTSIKTEFIQNVLAIAMIDEFYESVNPTFLEVYEDGNPDNEPIYITEIGLYNENKELIAIGKTSEPIPKNRFNVITFQVQLKL